ncbi:VOC family protein [Microlunatus capsulatus]|uniref:PhnB protein n=1 Tax=Microlunatus capsulatus TaxID=99117 RepID=A0ABS4Z2N7_9ACTN|nr:VOC family protein [Microlunatus capsulatus]MBP2415321.1 PhnB protein [Microlunatus capsulatus]
MSAIAPWLSVRDAAAAVAFYRRAFGATTGELAEGGGVLQVGELFVGGARFWVQHDPELPAGHDPGRAVRMILTVTDPDAAFSRALDAGAVEIAGVHDEGAWRTGRLVDPFGHQWELARLTP